MIICALKASLCTTNLNASDSRMENLRLAQELLNLLNFIGRNIHTLVYRNKEDNIGSTCNTSPA